MKSAEIIETSAYCLSNPQNIGAGLATGFFALNGGVSIIGEVVRTHHGLSELKLDELQYQFSLPYTASQNQPIALLLENIHPKAAELFKAQGYLVETHSGAMEEEELIERIRDVSVLGIRSKTHVTERVLASANKLLAVGAFCIGTNQIDLDACLRYGVAAFNAPYSNTRSVVEMAIGQIIMLSRNILSKSEKMHQGIWDKSANGSFEVRGKKLGIVGYGSIGSQLSVVAESLGMEVYYYDVVEKLRLGNAKKCTTLKELLGLADFVSLHVDGRESNTNLIGPVEFEMMKEGVVFLNLSRGHVVDVPSLVQNVKSGKIRGAAVDVFPYEPVDNKEEFTSELRGLPNVILTPHIGGSTSEAQESIASFVPERLLEYINTGNTYQSVNFPNIQLPELKDAHRLIHIHHNMPGILANINHVLAKSNVNVLGQYLKTNDRIGYVVTDIDKSYPEEEIRALMYVKNTIQFRVVS